MYIRQPHHKRGILFALAAILVVSAMGSGRATAQTITEIIDSAGDGAGNGLNQPFGLAVDSAGNVYVTSSLGSRALKITPTGVITQIIFASGDSAGNLLDFPEAIAVDAAGNAYVAGAANAFKIPPPGAGDITEIIDAFGDGTGNGLDSPSGSVASVPAEVVIRTPSSVSSGSADNERARCFPRS